MRRRNLNGDDQKPVASVDVLDMNAVENEQQLAADAP